ncbi:MAG: hypothetical protein RL060_1666 [Bacteroidota bacterium]|jgi:hypothetical protein
MGITANQVTIVQKEDLIDFKYAKKDVLVDVAKQRLRSIYMKKAEMLGNSYKGKVKLTFVSEDEQFFAVETTIWAVNEEYISLKGGVNIPTKAVCEIEF